MTLRALYYHSVVSRRDPDDFGATNAIQARELADHARQLARRWRVLSLAEVLECHKRGRFPDRAVHVSFDDGYRDNLTAAEIFDSHHLPWTLFVVVDAVLDGYVPWYVRLADALAASSAVVRWGDHQYDLSQRAHKLRFKARAKTSIMAAPAGRHLAVLEEILARPGIVRSQLRGSPFLSAEELDDLAGRGVEIGNHSASHPNLTRCDGEHLRREVRASQARLELAIGRPVPFFSYPDGRFDGAVLSEVADSHQLAMATWTSRSPLSPFQLRRFPVGSRPEDLAEVLAAHYPLRYRGKRARWVLRRHLRGRTSRPADQAKSGSWA